MPAAVRCSGWLGDSRDAAQLVPSDLREKLARYSGRWCVRSDIFDENRSWAKLTTGAGYTVDSDSFCWGRLAVQHADFDDHDLIPLAVKQKDRRARAFIEKHGDECAEVDALPPSELRSRVRQAIESHIDQERWKRLQETERLEKETLDKVMKRWKKVI